MLKNVIKSKVKKGAKFAERKLDISTPATKLGRIDKPFFSELGYH
jgi:hypothetical protein